MANLLQTVARLYNIQVQYRDGFGQIRSAPDEAVLSALNSLGAPVRTHEDLPEALRLRRRTQWQTAIEPVIVCWDDRRFRIKLRLPARLAQSAITGELILENGDRQGLQFDEAAGVKPVFKTIEGTACVARYVSLQPAPPLGYHRLNLRVGDLELASLLISAPAIAYAPPHPKGKRWGVFCPVYALNSARSWGAGDFADLENFAHWVGSAGGDAVAVLPLLASFLDEPFNPSPYAPVSRLFWNEFYLDVTRIAEFAACRPAQDLLASADFQDALNRARAASLIDYRGVMALKRKVLEELLKFFLKKRSQRLSRFKAYAANHPLARDYSAFRARVERERASWLRWADGGERNFAPKSYDDFAYQYHLYAQWHCDDQTHRLRERAERGGAALYLDFPLGVNRDGFDVWREREIFALNASGGAPPDGLFVKGQNWGFPPFNPEALRRREYRYYIDCVRHHMAIAGMLRIDHVMGLHRAFWVPEGFSAADGLYVHSRAEEFYAILSLESHRHRVQIVGENLGTVPFYVNEAMARHKILGMHVGVFGVDAEAPENVLEKIPKKTVASLNTHDTATFMGFWSGADIQDRVSLGLTSEAQARDEAQYRAAQRRALTDFLRRRGLLADETDDPAAVLEAWLCFLAGNDEEFLLINLEDLWLEPSPQNVPGTWQERPNWQRRARLTLEALHESEPIGKVLRRVDDSRAAIG
jgi:4-alpha-glucanotransferase